MTITEMSLAAALVAASTAAGVAFWNAQSARLEAGRKADLAVRAALEWGVFCADSPRITRSCRRPNHFIHMGDRWDDDCLLTDGDARYRGWFLGRDAAGNPIIRIRDYSDHTPQADVAALAARGAVVRGAEFELTLALPVVRDQQTRAWMLPDAVLDRGVLC